MAGADDIDLRTDCNRCPDIGVIKVQINHIFDRLDKHMNTEEKEIHKVATEHKAQWEEVRNRLHKLGDDVNHHYSQSIVDRQQCKQEIEKDVDSTVQRVHSRLDEIYKVLDEYVTKKDFQLALGVATVIISVMIWLSSTFATSTTQETTAQQIQEIQQLLIKQNATQPGAKP